DIGSQYRSAIFYHNDTEKQLAEKFISDLNQSGKFNKPVAAEVIKFTEFWPAEKYHQDYIMKNPGDSYVRNESIPRLKRTQKQIPDLIKPDKSVLNN
ncbi:MAG: peptide-methionine (S)-S-oxide reductase, partial [Bacteroidota bacterium]|nr:peptide-methionine (S)-S-oxide reductase [Bacteroidota bacterium]